MKRHIHSLAVLLSLATPSVAQEALIISGVQTEVTNPAALTTQTGPGSVRLAVLPLDRVRSISVSQQEDPRSLSALLKADPTLTLMTAALEATGWMDALKTSADPSYSVGADSTRWANNALVYPTGSEYDNVAYPTQRWRKHTLFAVPDDVLRDAYGITTLDQLRAHARKVYDEVFPDDAGVADERNARNSLNRLVAYHLLPFEAGYYQLTEVDGSASTLAQNWDRIKADISDWYATCMAGASMKLSFPRGTMGGLYVNRRGVMSRADAQEVFVLGARVTPPSEAGRLTQGINGTYHYVAGLLAYDQTTQHVVLHDRWRVDCTTLSPDFITSGARGHYTLTSIENGKYGRWDGTADFTNVNLSLGFKAGTAENFDFTDSETHLHVRPRALTFWSYGGDEVIVGGEGFDVTVSLPPLPQGEWEVRLGTTVDFDSRGLVQFYLGHAGSALAPCGVPVDMTKSGQKLCGWQSDYQVLGTVDAYSDEGRALIADFDQQLRAQGWMKGPASYYSASTEKGGMQGSCFRDLSNTLRYIVGRVTSDGHTPVRLRLRQVAADGKHHAIPLDYIELIPTELIPFEDIY